jgi:choline kinase
MQAIIMAAGKGNRMGALTEEKPKAFLEIQNIKLIEYNLALLHENGIHSIVLVTGYKNEMFEDLTKQIAGAQCVYNPFYEMVNVLGSFYMAQEYLQKEDTVYLHADTLCDPQIFSDMIQTSGDMVLPVEFKACDEEAMKVLTDKGKLLEISKQIPCESAEGEFIGIAKISGSILEDLKATTKKLMKEKQFSSYFEGAIQELMNQKDYNFVTLDTKGRFWGEVDFLEDYERVKNNMPDSLLKLARKAYA